MKQIVQAVHEALERRWKKAGSPAHATELCLRDMQRFIDDQRQPQTGEQILAEAVDLLEQWIVCGKPATEEETTVIHKAKTFKIQQALAHVNSIFPEVIQVFYGADGRWLYCGECFESPNFAGKEVDTGLLEDAADTVEAFPSAYLLDGIELEE